MDATKKRVLEHLKDFYGVTVESNRLVMIPDDGTEDRDYEKQYAARIGDRTIFIRVLANNKITSQPVI